MENKPEEAAEANGGKKDWAEMSDDDAADQDANN